MSIKRLLLRARDDVLADRINIFDQMLAQIWRAHNTKQGHGLIVALQGRTYNKYTKAWTRVLSFIYRVILMENGLPEERQLRQRIGFRLTDE